jgi:anti-anti-sigma factor
MIIDIERQNDLCIVRCRGRLIAGPDSEYMLSKMDEIKRLNYSMLLVDFREVPAIGSMGVTFIVGLYTSVVRQSSARFVLVGAVPQVRQVLDLTRLSTIIRLAPNVSSGLAALCAHDALSSHVCV